MRLDTYDRHILDALQKDGRISNVELAEKVGLSTAPCWRRVRTLETQGVIRCYVALLDPVELGLGLRAFVHVSLDLHHADEFEAGIRGRPEVIECYAMTGDQDYLLHVLVTDMASFDTFVRHHLIRMAGVERVRSSFTLTVVKQTTVLVLPEEGERDAQRGA